MTVSTNDQGVVTSALLEDLLDAYERLETPTERYLLLVVLPSILFVILGVPLLLVVGLPLFVTAPLALLSVLGAVTAVVYPKVRRDQRQRNIDNHFHMAVTHLTVLATTNISRMEVFRSLAEEDAYEEFSKEIDRLVQLVDIWNQSLDDACRRRSREIPSDMMSDFLDRLAYSLASGQELIDFLESEQEVIIQNYKTVYESTLENLDVMQDLYLSMILSMTFALVFATVLPILTGNNPTVTVGAVIVLFVFVQIGFYVAIRAVAPNDPVWYHPEEFDTGSQRRVKRALLAGAAATVPTTVLSAAGLFGLLPVSLETFLPVETPPLAMYAALAVTPMAVPGVVLRVERKKIRKRDEEFPSFIRGLGATESAKQSTTSAVLADMRDKDFGVLTPNIDDLYRRLNMRIDPTVAWANFAADTRSYLIQRYSEMYLVGRRMGGDPKELGELISENMNEVQQLRQRRRQATVTLIGLLYGITAAATFAFYIGLQVVRVLANISSDIDTGGTAAGQLINTAAYDIPVIEFLILAVVLFNAMLSSLMIRTTDGGHKANAFVHFVLLVWVGGAVSVVVKVMVAVFLNVG